MSDQTTHDVMVEQTAAARDLIAYFQGVRTQLEADRVRHSAAVDAFIQEGAANFPVTPNLLADSKYFKSLCAGDVNVEKEIITGHSSSAIFAASLLSGSTGHGTIEVVSLDQLANKGIPHGGDLAKACSETFSGADFRVLLLDVTLSGGAAGKDPEFVVLNQGDSTFSGWGQGEFRTQAACFLNVVESSGDTEFHAHSNMAATVAATPEDLGKGWVYKHATRTGWGGYYHPRFRKSGRMKVAMALPYVGFGDHKGAYIHANSVGRYSHGEDYLEAGKF